MTTTSRIARLAAGVWWYVREVAGETAYDRYLVRSRAHGHEAPVLTRREFERRRQDDRNGRPEQRCC